MYGGVNGGSGGAAGAGSGGFASVGASLRKRFEHVRQLSEAASLTTGQSHRRTSRRSSAAEGLEDHSVAKTATR